MDPLVLLILGFVVVILLYMISQSEQDYYSSSDPATWTEIDARDDDD